MDELAEAEIDAILERVGYGFLGLARGDRPYVVPMSFGYEDDLYFQMNSQGRKFDFIEQETPACFTVFQFDREEGTSRSVLVEGNLGEVPESETSRAYGALSANASFGTDLSLWGVPLQDADPALFVLRADAVSGRMFGGDV